MAEVMTPASPYRSPEILAKEKAIKDRLATWNTSNQKSAQTKANKQVADWKKKLSGKPNSGWASTPLKDAPRTFTQNYNTQAIKGADQGFTPSDYGVGAGAAIPYQIGTTSNTASAKYTPPKAKAITKRLIDAAKKQ